MSLEARSTDPMLVEDTAPNPLFGPTSPMEHREIKVVRTLRGDTVGQLFARGHIDATQCEAARRWQRDAETAGPRIKSAGDLQEPVDAAHGLPKGITDRQVDASRRLEHYAVLLGPRQHQLLTLVLQRGFSLWGATAAMFPDDISPPNRRFVGTWFREILSVLAKDMGLAG